MDHLRPYVSVGKVYQFMFLLLMVFGHWIGTDAVNYWKRLGPMPSDLKIGSSCKSSLQCLLFIPNSHCDWDDRICTCQPYYILYNNTNCLPASLLGFGCSITDQCTLKVPNSECVNGLCQCRSKFIPLRRDKCLPPAKIDDYCLNDQQCILGGKYTYCKYIIPRIYGKCKCPSGYIVTEDNRCLPQLSNRCESDGDCMAVTPDAYCKKSPSTVRSTDKRKTESVCACKEDFEMSKDKQHCEAIIKAAAAVPITLLDDVLDESGAAQNLEPVSLGKPCITTMECQIRDPYSACINGICECIRTSSSCSSINRGCHNDTFQCRNGQCISWYFVCDRHKNCEDGSDEECGAFRCPKESFQCNDGTCLSRGAVCNGRWECPDGSDEARCYKGIPCDRQSFRCNSGQCLPHYVFCNAVTDCIDGSDEEEAICEQSESCPYGTFSCENNRCRSTAILCSGLDGCGDNSDEDKCEICYCEKP